MGHPRQDLGRCRDLSFPYIGRSVTREISGVFHQLRRVTGVAIRLPFSIIMGMPPAGYE